MLLMRRRITLPNGKKAMRSSNTVKIIPFSGIERQVDALLTPKEPMIKDLLKGFIAFFAFGLTVRLDVTMITQLLQNDAHQVIIFSPTIKLASYVVVSHVLYRLLLELLKIVKDLVRGAILMGYDFALKRQWIPYHVAVTCKERFVTAQDVTYQPKRKYHQGGYQ